MAYGANCVVSWAMVSRLKLEALSGHRIPSESIKASERIRECIGGSRIKTFLKPFPMGPPLRAKGCD